MARHNTREQHSAEEKQEDMRVIIEDKKQERKKDKWQEMKTKEEGECRMMIQGCQNEEHNYGTEVKTISTTSQPPYQQNRCPPNMP